MRGWNTLRGHGKCPYTLLVHYFRRIRVSVNLFSKMSIKNKIFNIKQFQACVLQETPRCGTVFSYVCSSQGSQK